MKESREFLGDYTLTQSSDCFKLGRDSVLLAQFSPIKRDWRVCDLGCGIGSLLLLLSQRRPHIQRYGIEIDPHAADLARRNLADNGLEGEILTGDLRTLDLLPPDSFHLVISNPPYFKKGTGKSGGVARMEECCPIQDLCAVASRLLRTGGYFAVVFRAERMAELFSAMHAAEIEPKRMQILCYDRKKPPYAILVEGVKRGGVGLRVLPVHYQNTKEGTPCQDSSI